MNRIVNWLIITCLWSFVVLVGCTQKNSGKYFDLIEDYIQKHIDDPATYEFVQDTKPKPIYPASYKSYNISPIPGEPQSIDSTSVETTTLDTASAMSDEEVFEEPIRPEPRGTEARKRLYKMLLLSSDKEIARVAHEIGWKDFDSTFIRNLEFRNAVYQDLKDRALVGDADNFFLEFLPEQKRTQAPPTIYTPSNPDPEWRTDSIMIVDFSFRAKEKGNKKIYTYRFFVDKNMTIVKYVDISRSLSN